MALHDIRFVEDDWESPTLGAWGLGWEVWCDGMEVSQFTYFQQVGGHDCKPVSGELTYGLERLAMYVLGVDHVMDMPFNAPSADPAQLWRRVPPDRGEYSRWNFDVADTDAAAPFRGRRGRMRAHPERRRAERPEDRPAHRHGVLPAYDQCIKASHLFNLLDARGVISTTERQAYIGRCLSAFLRVSACSSARFTT
jgi:glycyl-tRNA synthetase alpha chain